jgi:starvation-inducible DNA-binding protein
MEHTIGIKEENRSHSAAVLNVFLADEFLLHTKTRNAHWNVEGADFLDKHKFFEEQFEQLDDIMDSLAERIRTLDHYASATLRLFLRLTHLTEEADQKNDSKGFIKILVGDHESLIINFRKYIARFANEFHDQGTSDFITGIMEKHEKMAWLLREHLR